MAISTPRRRTLQLQLQQLAAQGTLQVGDDDAGNPARFNGDVAVAGANGEAALHGGHLFGQGVADVLGGHRAVKVGLIW